MKMNKTNFCPEKLRISLGLEANDDSSVASSTIEINRNLFSYTDDNEYTLSAQKLMVLVYTLMGEK